MPKNKLSQEQLDFLAFGRSMIFGTPIDVAKERIIAAEEDEEEVDESE